MSNWKQTHKNLLTKVIARLDSNEPAVSKKVNRLANKLGVDSAAALYKIATDCGIKSSRDRAKLSPHDINTLMNSGTMSSLPRTSAKQAKASKYMDGKSGVPANKKKYGTTTSHAKEWIINNASALIVTTLGTILAALILANFFQIGR